MTTEKVTLVRRILNLDRRLVIGLLVIFLVLPLLHPFALPVTVDAWTKAFYNRINSLPAGSTIVIGNEAQFTDYSELVPQMKPVYQQIFNQKGLRFIAVCFSRPDCQIVFDTMVIPSMNQGDKKYGADWVDVGYLQGIETAMAAFAANFLYAGKDVHGTPLSSLPLMNEVKSMKDVKLFIVFGGQDFQPELRQLGLPYNVPTIAGLQAVSFTDAQPYFSAGTIVGMINGLPGAAQYEYLANMPGVGLASSDAITMGHMYLLALIVITNIAFFVRRKGEKQ